MSTKTFVIYLFVVCVLVCCIKEKITDIGTFLHNRTNHRIQLISFGNAGARIKDTLVINGGERIEIGREFIRGIVNNAVLLSDYINFADSIHIVFDGRYKISHYTTTPVALANRYYLDTSKRNLLQIRNYVFTFKDVSKYQRNSEYTYTFTEQDYLDAK